MIQMHRKVFTDNSTKFDSSLFIESNKAYLITTIFPEGQETLEVLQELHSFSEVAEAFILKLPLNASRYEIFSTFKTWEKFFLTSTIFIEVNHNGFIEERTFSLIDAEYSLTEESIILEGEASFNLFMSKFH